jgi:two pore calcium channel protein
MTGMILFGGEVTLNNSLIENDSGVPSTYPYDNFNDMLTGMVTLFTLLIVNNWQVQVEMYVDIKHGNTYYRIFFIVVYFFCVVMLLNIVVAFSIDMYASVQRLNNQRDE